MRDTLSFMIWWLLVTSTGFLVWPLLFRVLSRLPDRGYSLSKICGLLVLGYAFWLPSSLGYLRLTVGGILIACIIVAAAGLGLGKPKAAIKWMGEHRNLVLASEAVFFVGFAVWAYVRALNPEIVGTEKPMEYAFLNSILRSGVMPPRDPWLSGYAISYYYFGYVIIAVLTCLSGVTSGVAFNLGVALLFGLASVGSFGVALNLISVSAISVDRRAGENGRKPSLVFPALLAPVFTVVVGNLNGLLEVLHQRGMGSERFWQWLGIQWLDVAPTPTDFLLPQRYLWWWQASRVIRDRDLTGEPIGLQPIEEFPFFSFLLGDLHPHVLALPFVFLALAVAVQMYLTAASGQHVENEWMPFPILHMVFFAFVLGGLAFLNTWDFPVYLFVAVAAYGAGRRAIGAAELRLGIILAGGGALLYWPFYLGFRSQASGILPNPAFSTQINQFTVLFGVLLVPAMGWLVWEAVGARRALNWRLGALVGPGVLVGLLVSCAALTIVVSITPYLRETYGTSLLFGMFSTDEYLQIVLRRRFIESPWTPLFLGGALILVGCLMPCKPERPSMEVHATPFVALLFGVGAVLTLVPEFLYLRDGFGTRMNTIFKLYYQAWALWSIVAAYACWSVRHNAGRKWRTVFGLAALFSVTVGLIYPVLSIWTKTERLQGTTVIRGERVAMLDGVGRMAQSHDDDHAAINWLNHFIPADGVVAEAVGGSYSDYGRVSVHSGLPTVLGWPGHELQWRGGFEMAAGREEAVKTLYSTGVWDEAAEVLARYDINYVYVGSLERDQYPEHALDKFENYMYPIYRNSGVTIYERMNAK